MTTPSELAILRVYLPHQLVDEIHGLARQTGLPMRTVVRGILELGLTKYIGRWVANCAPTYDDELSSKPYQPRSHLRGQDWRVVLPSGTVVCRACRSIQPSDERRNGTDAPT